MVADALSRKSRSSVANLRVFPLSYLIQLRAMNVKLNLQENGVLVATLQVRPILRDRIKAVQNKDPQLQEKIEKVKQGKREKS